ncbi:hypothetical protein KQX54_011586 [Cotesia glomerata]|uniref:Uncharacterized protein n=1 Tax=Cotesia glomerata TaxID=32391 RepID=A0AAV7I7H1_COTGL|nr:hypothetical protein KQX54_011586 [Cotesia glomerata]
MLPNVRSSKKLFSTTPLPHINIDPKIDLFSCAENLEKLSLLGFKCTKLIGCNTPEPAIDLDNRYRLMRHEQMLDAQGNPTDKFIKDSRVYSFEEYIEIHNLNQ